MIGAAIHHFFVREGIQPCRIVVAVSGGADSTALLLGLAELREHHFDLLAAHVNHHLRGADSDADEDFVRELCARLAVPLRVADGTLPAQRIRDRGVEAAAREVRYACLTAIRDADGARYVATAHQKNDQAETVLMRLLTGSGVAGLRGIHPIRDDGVIRPLLGVTRAEIEAFLRQRGVVPRVDRSNDDARFLRNRVRAFLREIEATENLARVAEQARAQWPLLERAVDEAERACVTITGDETRFEQWPEEAWIAGALLQRHIRRLDPGARDFDAARIAAQADGIKRMSVTGHLELVRRGTALVLRRPPEPAEEFEVELTEATPAYIAPLRLTIRVRNVGRASARPERSPDDHGRAEARPTLRDGRAEARPTLRQLVQLPEGAAAVFTVRNRRAGDRFQPLGMSVSKKLKDFLIDRRIEADVRDRLPLLVWNGEIVWVAGVEVSERFKVTDAGGPLYEVWTDDRDQAGLQR